MVDERPEGISAKIPGKGNGRGKAGDVKTSEFRCKCIVDSKKLENLERVRSTAMAKNEHHLEKLNVSTAIDF